MLSSINALEELVLSGLSASPLMKLLFTPDGWQVENGCTDMFQWAWSGCVYLARTQFKIVRLCIQ